MAVQLHIETRDLGATKCLWEGLVWQIQSRMQVYNNARMNHTRSNPFLTPRWRLGGRLCETTLTYSDMSSPTSKGKQLGVGSYGSVEELEINSLIDMCR